MPSIPASALVSVIPGVIGAGGSALDIVGVFLTNNTQLPIGSVTPFSSAADVATYFGALSTEAALATTYFRGYTGSAVLPAKIYFRRYATAAVAGYLRGGSVAALTLTQLQALSGVLTLTVGGTSFTSASINLASATSFSNAAALIQAGFTSPTFAVTYDSLSGAFVLTSTATGTAASITVASGSLAAPLNLTTATGAVTSQGVAAFTPAVSMADLIAKTQDWVLFTTTWEPSDSDKVAFAKWSDGTNNRFGYVGWTTNITATQSGDTISFGALVRAAGYSGTTAIYDPNNPANIAAFVMGYAASMNFNALNGRATAAYRTSGQIAAGVTNETIGDNLSANGYNFVGAYATANDNFTFFMPGQISGEFLWLDSWICQVWLNNALQLALVELLASVGQIPYTADGFAIIEAGMADPINAALNFGAIRAGVDLSAAQETEVNTKAGAVVASVLETRGWYISIQDPGATVRAARGSPIINLFYTDGQSVQQIVINSAQVQ